ncbi:MAG: TonB-dependent receptor [Lentimicrobiaceae bacterium]|nr:TonB-dependent receptor [Lentimicrobiaceae bacterium]
MNKLLVLFLLVSLWNIRSVSAQSPDRILVDGRYYGNTVKQILADISKRYPVQFDYFEEDLPLGIIQGRTYVQKPLTEILTELLALTDLEYSIVEDYIILRKKGVSINPEDWKYERKSNFQLTGIIRDKTNGETLPFANILLRGTKTGTSANTDGHFTLFNIPTDTAVLDVYYVGYKKQAVFLSPKLLSKPLLIEMTPESTELSEVMIMGKREDLLEIPEKANIVSMTPKEMNILPSLGDQDIFRTFQLLPGISGSNESSSGLYVRGGTPDQNLIIFDGFTIYHQEHLYGLFSAFNTNAIKDVQLYKGGFEAKYGGRLSSVMEIIGKTGNEKQFDAGLDISMLSVDGYMEIPLAGKGSIFLAARKSYTGWLYNKLTGVFSDSDNSPSGNYTPPSMPSGGSPPPGMGFMPRGFETTEPTSFFYDLNAKATFKTNEKNLFALSFFNGQDNLDASRDIERPMSNISVSGENEDVTKWGNRGVSMRWSHKWNEKLYTNNLVSYSRYFNIRNRSSERIFVRDSVETINTRESDEDNTLNDWSFKVDNEYNINKNHLAEFGLQYNFYNTRYTFGMNDSLQVLDRNDKGSLLAVYIQDKWSPLLKFYTLPGLRLSYFDGTGKIYAESRIQFSYKPSRLFTLQCAWGIYYQFVNRVNREDIMMGDREFWILADGDEVPVGKAIHYTAGVKYEDPSYVFNIEAYYKTLHDISEFTMRFDSWQIGESSSTYFYKGDGIARGIEFLFQKKYGDLSGWMGYTLGQVIYDLPVYGEGYYPASHDVTHEFKWISSYRWKKWIFSATWIYATGKPYTEPTGSYTLTLPGGEEMTYILAGNKNSILYPAYHRLDISARYHYIFGDMFNGDIGISLFNVYNRKNIWYKEFEIDETGLTETNVYLLGITPNVSFSIRIR